ncbi:MAG: hypothetical protein A2Y57_02730 [Candidatus Woykebacteria bacterium RBG_13_40_7b]|uniref:Heat-inducible transcription repressor HrcA n=1 Tax=Candidatus Woykebacteria bacterium RBG_13_40_7b TaxID=1802594 RepID=A0A1G1WBK5_9BACT|nr:MAG: hypothetical protein A2Y57_02730 [Candidatus Woykebacteria bacterium RBG_13_40_7b]
MEDLNSRQQDLLKAVVEEYTSTAEPVGSENLVEKYNLGISPATVRNEMVRLTELGYLAQPHTSAGRIPTPTGIKFYINSLMKEQSLPVKDEVAVREELWEHRFEFPRLLKLSARRLAEKTGSLALAASDEGELYHFGSHAILDMPEFYDIDLTKTILLLLDQNELLGEIFNKAVGEEEVHVLIGDDLGYEYLRPCSIVFSHFGSGVGKSGAIGVVGPSRMEYNRIFPTVRYFGSLLDEISSLW